MKKNKKLMRVFGGMFITLGILVSFLICGVIVWGDLEASMFTDGIVGDKNISTLRCPVIITGNETGTISVVVKNQADRDSIVSFVQPFQKGMPHWCVKRKPRFPSLQMESKKWNGRSILKTQPSRV